MAAELKADPDNGTTIQHIHDFLVNQSFEVSMGTGATVQDLKASIDAGVPALVCYQAWPDVLPVDWANDWIDGHYSLVVGYNVSHFFFMDPSTLGFYATIPILEFELRWHDIDGVDTKVVHFALYARYPKAANPPYNPYTILYLD